MELKFIPKIKEEEEEEEVVVVKSIGENYSKFVEFYSYIKIPVFAVALVFGFYIFFVAGNRYTISEYNRIQTIMISVLGIIGVSLIVIAILFFIKLKALTTKIKKLSLKYNFPYKEFRKEASFIIRSTLGGPGF